MYGTHTYKGKRAEYCAINFLKDKSRRKFSLFVKTQSSSRTALVILFENKSIAVSYFGFSWLRVWITVKFHGRMRIKFPQKADNLLDS
jgi:hypothetical protein